jgi:polar amino acid transport system permease protein
MFEISDKLLANTLFIVEGVGVTLQYSLLSVTLGLCIGSILAVFKTSRYLSLRSIGSLYTSVFRGTPLLIQLMIVYNGIPIVFGAKIGVFASGVIAFSLNSGAYVSEIIRAGINAVDPGQMEAARVLGVSDKTAMKDIILPQAIRKVLPALVNELVNLLKESAIISFIGEEDIMRRAQMVSAQSYTFFTPMITAAICYYILVIFFSNLAKILEKRLTI